MKHVQPSFASGELSPSLWSRVDFEKFHSGAKVIKNMICLAEGGVANRPGLKYVEGPDGGLGGTGVFIPFEFNTDQTYELVFVDEKMYVIRNGGFVLYDGGMDDGEIVEVTSPYAVEDLPNVRYAQSADTLFLVHPDYTPYSLTRTAHDAWTFMALVFATQATAPVSVVAAPPGAEGATGQVVHTYQVFPVRDNGDIDTSGSAILSRTVLDPWTGSVTLSWTYGAGSYNGTYNLPHGWVYRDGTPYRAAPFTGNYHGTFVDSNQGASGSPGSVASFAAAPTNFAASYDSGGADFRDYKYVVSAVVNGDESKPSIEVIGRADNPWVSGESITITWSGVENATLYNIYKNSRGQWGWIGSVNPLNTSTKSVEDLNKQGAGYDYVVTITAHGYATGDTVIITNLALGAGGPFTITVIDADTFSLDGTTGDTTVEHASDPFTAQKTPATALIFRDDNIDPDTTFGVRGDQIADLTTSNNYPAAVALYQQRLMFSGSNLKPTTILGSRIGSLLDFSISDPTRVDDPISVIPASGKVNGVRHMVPLNGLLVFTAGSEILLKGSDGSLKTNNAEFDFQSYIGCAESPAPLTINKSVIFPQRDGKKIHDYAFKLEVDGYDGNDLNVLANHVFRDSKLTSWCYQQSPYGTIWGTRADGSLRGMTYLREHQVYAWHRHDTDGLFKAVGSITGTEQDDVYFIVQRTVDDDPVYYVEKLVPRVADGGAFLDCHSTYAGSPATTISGLDYLEGRTVTALADKNVIENLTVSGGAVTLPHAASSVHVGLPYVSELQTLDLDVNSQQGNNQGKKQKISRVVIRLLETRGGSIGPDSDHLFPIPYRSFETFNQATGLFTGDKDQSISQDWGRSCKLTVRQTAPLPITILALIPDVELGS